MAVLRLTSPGGVTRSALLRIEAPSAAAAFVLAGSLAKFRARAVAEGDRWLVVVALGSAGHGVIPEALSLTRAWLLECEVPAASVSYDGQAHLLRRDDLEPPSR